MISALQKIRLSCWLHLIKTWVWVQYRLNYRLNYRVCIGWNPNDEKQWKAGPVLFVFEMKLARMPEETVSKLKRSRQMFQVSYNSFYFILSYWCHTNSLNISRPYWPWNTRTRGFHVRNFWPCKINVGVIEKTLEELYSYARGVCTPTKRAWCYET